MNIKQRGFSLLELLVVMVIIGIVVTVALFAFGNTTNNKQIQNAGERLANLIPVVEEQAILEPNIYGLIINVNGYGFERVVTQNGKKQWVAVTDDPLLNFQAWPSGTKIQLNISQQSTAAIPGPAIIITPSGNLTAFTLQLGNDKPLLSIQASEGGAVKQTPL